MALHFYFLALKEKKRRKFAYGTRTPLFLVRMTLTSLIRIILSGSVPTTVRAFADKRLKNLPQCKTKNDVGWLALLRSGFPANSLFLTGRGRKGGSARLSDLKE